MHDHATPDEVEAFDRALGVVKYSFFGEAGGGEAELQGAVVWHLAKVLAREYGQGWMDPAVLPELPRRLVDRRTFFGPGFDPDRDALVRLGSGTMTDGTRWDHPTYSELGDRRTAEWRQAGSPGGYSYAFCEPVHPLQLTWAEIQDLFLAIIAMVLPAEGGETIVDWSGPALGGLCEHFTAGLETACWGAFLWTVFDPTRRRLTVISAATGP